MKTYAKFNESKVTKYDDETFSNVDNALNEYKKELRKIIIENNPDLSFMEINIIFDDYREDIEECFSNDIDVMDCYDQIIINYE